MTDPNDTVQIGWFFFICAGVGAFLGNVLSIYLFRIRKKP